MIVDRLREAKVVWRIYKFKESDIIDLADALRKGYKPYAIEEFHGNVLLNEGIQELWDLACGLGTPTPFDATNSYLGVGDGTTAEDPTQTGLVGVNKLYKAMDSGYPSRSAQTVTWQSTFGATQANYAWNEYTVANGPDNTAKNLNRKVEAKGTKVEGETWVLQLQITLS